MRIRITPADELAVGDRIEHGDVIVTVLRPPVTGQDRFGRTLQRFWSRREDTGEEGFMSYGSGGVACLLKENTK